MEKHFENTWKVPRPFEIERSNTIPGSSESFDSDEACSSLVRPHSCELFGIHKQLSEKFGNRVWKANNERTSAWSFSHNIGIEDLNYSLQYKLESPKTMQIKDRLERLKIEYDSKELREESENHPTEKSVSQSAEQSASQLVEQSANQSAEQSASQSAEQSASQSAEQSASQSAEQSVNQPLEKSTNRLKEESVNQREQKFPKVVFIEKEYCHPNLDRPIMKLKIKIPDEILARREKNENYITPIKKPKSYQDMINELRPIVPCASRKFAVDASSPVVSTVDCNEREPQARQSAEKKPKKNGQSQLKTSKKVEKSFSRFCRYYMLLLLSVTLGLFSIGLNEIQKTHKPSSDFATSVVELKKRIYGQDQPLQDLCEYLQRDVPSSKVIILVGGTGVGKSYTVEVIKKNFPRPYAISQYFPPIEAIKDSNFPLIYPNLIILENLKERDVQAVIKYLKTHQDTNKDRFVTVLLVFNVDGDSMLRSQFIIRNSFLNENIEAEIISYQPLNEDALEMCIMNAVIESKLILTKKQFDLVKRNLLINGSGCKGAYRQVQVIGRQSWK